MRASGRTRLISADHRQHAAQFFVGGDGRFLRRKLASGLRRNPRRGFDHNAGAGGFTAYVEDVRAFVEQLEAVFDGMAAVEELAAVGKRVGGYVDHAHDERTASEL